MKSDSVDKNTQTVRYLKIGNMDNINKSLHQKYTCKF